MAYATENFVVGSKLGGVYELSMWMYPTADSEATVEGSGYFSDFYAKGGKVGDEIRVYIYTSAIPASVRPAPANSTTPVAALTAAAPTQVSTYIVTGITAAGAATISPNDNIVTPPPPPP